MKATLSVRVDPELKRQLEDHAAAVGSTVSAHTIMALKLYLAMNGGDPTLAQFELLDRVAGLESEVRELERKVRNLDAWSMEH